MKSFRFTLLFVVLAFLSLTEVHASLISDSAVFVIQFDESSTTVRLDKYGNGVTMDAIINLWNRIQADSTLEVKDICCMGNASWEGDYAFNKRLGDIRAWTTANYVSRMSGINYDSIHQDVAPWLKNEQKSLYPENIIAEMRNFKNRCCRIVFKYGPYTPEIQDNIETTHHQEEVEAFLDTTMEATADSTTEIIPDSTEEAITEEISTETITEAPQVILTNPWTLKTNLLYDALTVASLSLEAGFCKHWAIDILTTFSPWDINSTFKIRTHLIQPEVRYYLKKGVFTGHYFGLEGHVGWYNVAWKDSPTRYQDRDGNTPLWGAGLTYGYVLPFGNPGTPASHWGMDFEIGVGYANLKYDCFYNTENGAKYTTVSKDWFGPTKLGILIYYRF